MSEPEPSNPRPRVSRWRRWLVELALIAVVLIGIQWWQTRGVPSGPAPALAGQLLDGSAMNLVDERGRPVLVHFWAEWCPICRLEQGSIQSLSEDYRVISVATTSGDAAGSLPCPSATTDSPEPHAAPPDSASFRIKCTTRGQGRSFPAEDRRCPPGFEEHVY